MLAVGSEDIYFIWSVTSGRVLVFWAKGVSIEI
jgi:hypothetical protein